MPASKELFFSSHSASELRRCVGTLAACTRYPRTVMLQRTDTVRLGHLIQPPPRTASAKSRSKASQPLLTWNIVFFSSQKCITQTQTTQRASAGMTSVSCRVGTLLRRSAAQRQCALAINCRGRPAQCNLIQTAQIQRARVGMRIFPTSSPTIYAAQPAAVIGHTRRDSSKGGFRRRFRTQAVGNEDPESSGKGKGLTDQPGAEAVVLDPRSFVLGTAAFYAVLTGVGEAVRQAPVTHCRGVMRDPADRRSAAFHLFSDPPSSAPIASRTRSHVTRPAGVAAFGARVATLSHGAVPSRCEPHMDGAAHGTGDTRARAHATAPGRGSSFGK